MRLVAGASLAATCFAFLAAAHLMIVSRLELVDFRNYANASFDFQPGTTAVIGLNGQGKTNLAEAMAYLATLDSFRGAPLDALIRVGAESAVVRATVVHDDGREVLVELELSRNGRNRVLVNRQKLGRSRDLLGVMRVTVFSPDDLAVVKEGPGGRRRFLDDVLVTLALKYDALRLELDRIVKQRNMLLKQLGGRMSDEAALTLDVWDSKMAEVGDQFGHARAVLVARLTPWSARPTSNWPIGRQASSCVTSRRGANVVSVSRSPKRALTMCVAVCRVLVRIATTSSCSSMACRRALMRRRASSARLRWRCAWGRIDW